jgi:PncC family amidohydrolase
MEEICKKIVEKLNENKQTISFMESCTGGFLANSITNISGASNVLKVSLVTYSSEYKIKFGVNENVIKKYTVYSQETSIEMAKNIVQFAKSNIGVGITGELGNTLNNSPKVYYTVYFKDKNKYINKTITTTKSKRKDMKEEIAKKVFEDIWEEIK